MREDVRASTLLLDEAETLLGVEPLHGAGGHAVLLNHDCFWPVRYSPQHSLPGRHEVRRSDLVGRDHQVVEAVLLVGGQERLLDAGRHRRLGAQLPVRDGRGGQVDHADREQVVRRHGREVVAARVDVADVVGVDLADGPGRLPAVHVVVATGDGHVPAAGLQDPGVFREELVEVDVHGALVVPDGLEGGGGEAVVEHVPEVEAHPVGHAALAGLLVREAHLLLGDGDAVHLAAEAQVGQEAAAAAAGAGVQHPVVRAEIAELVEQEVGLRALQPVQLLDGPGFAGGLGAFQHRPVHITDAVVVVEGPGDLAEAQVDRVLLLVPVLGHRLLVPGGQDVGAGAVVVDHGHRGDSSLWL